MATILAGVVQAIERQPTRGTHYGASDEAEVEWGEWVQRLVPSAERVRFTSSGAEATYMAIRLAGPAACPHHGLVRGSGEVVSRRLPCLYAPRRSEPTCTTS